MHAIHEYCQGMYPGERNSMNSQKNMRPFDFMVPFWGQRYREYFVDLCLPSLLAPNNMPLLRAEDGHRFLIATTAADWQAIEDLPIMATLRKFVTPTFLEIPEKSTAPGGLEAVLYQ